VKRFRIVPRTALAALLLPLAAACSSDTKDAAKPAAPTAAKPAAAPAAPAAAASHAAPKSATTGDAQVAVGGSTAVVQVTKPAPAAPTPAAPASTQPAASAPAPMPAATAAPAPSAPAQENAMAAPAAAAPASFYGFKTTTLEGKPADLSQYKGKVVLVVNTASECGLTPQYKGLEALHEEMAPKGFSVLGFPSNDFGGQEPGSAEQIRTFCDTNYHVTFPLFTKVQTKAGDGQSPIYSWLQAQTNQLPRWNFGKYLIGKDGKVVQVFDSKVPPEDPALRAAIEKALGS